MIERNGRTEPPSSGESQMVGRVRVVGESSTQVAMSYGKGPVTMVARAPLGRDVELSGPVYLPKQCELQIEFAMEGGEPVATETVDGLVKKCQMTGPEPTYRVTLQMDAAALQRFDDWRAALAVPPAKPLTGGDR